MMKQAPAAAESPPSIAGPLSDADFKRELKALIPHLRAFARSLVYNRAEADDLVQDTMIRAWAARQRFQAGTNMRAWTFRILRNRHHSLWRTNRRLTTLEPEQERLMVMPADQQANLELADMHAALKRLPDAQREALLLVAVCGMSLEDAAQVSNCAVGTIKSRVSRARTALARLMEEGTLRSFEHGPTTVAQIVEEALEVQRRAAPPECLERTASGRRPDETG